MSRREDIRALCDATLAEIRTIRAPDVMSLRTATLEVLARLVHTIELRYGAVAGQAARRHVEIAVEQIIGGDDE